MASLEDGGGRDRDSPRSPQLRGMECSPVQGLSFLFRQQSVDTLRLGTRQDQGNDLQAASLRTHTIMKIRTYRESITGGPYAPPSL